jgi:hypothetical protein
LTLLEWSSLNRNRKVLISLNLIPSKSIASYYYNRVVHSVITKPTSLILQIENDENISDCALDPMI